MKWTPTHLARLEGSDEWTPCRAAAPSTTAADKWVVSIFLEEKGWEASMYATDVLPIDHLVMFDLPL